MKSDWIRLSNLDYVLISAKTNIKLDDQVKKNTDLWYVETSTNEHLPSSLTGLGYKNLLKIIFELVNYFQSLEKDSMGRLYLLFIEEPESHMHPQLQQRFIDFLGEYLKKLSTKEAQVILTTHSSHIVNQIDFNKVRYAKRKAHEVNYKDLDVFSKSHPANAKFIKKYLTLSKCDLFFADKAILFEGSSERLLLPKVIEKLAKENKFANVSIGLNHQHITLVEVGGTYAKLFFEFLDFLGIPTLILTDIDSSKNGKKSFVSEGTETSNPTIKHWLDNFLENKDNGDEVAKLNYRLLKN